MKATVDGEPVVIGNARMLTSQGIEHDAAMVAATDLEWSAQGDCACILILL